VRAVLHVDLAAGDARREAIDDPSLLGPLDYAVREGGSDLFLGAGPLSIAEVPGSNRLIVAGRSPLWNGFYVSTMGSAGGSLRATGADVVRLRGRAARPSVLWLGPGPVARLEAIDPDEAWRGEPSGTMALLARLGKRLDGPSRCLVVGPASRATRMGAIASALFREGEGVVLETWAGRGGFGTKLFREHGVVAIVFQGDPPARKALLGLVSADTVERATVKYRYHPGLKTGGTFGSNFTTLREKLLAWNARSTLAPVEERVAAYEALVEHHYLSQFNDEVVATKSYRDCGETCPAVCKKVAGGHKKDFQPYAALGPNVGVFDQRAAERLNAVADALGLDSVEAGGLVGWAFELAADRLIEPAEIGLWARPRFDPEGFDPIEDSATNARLAGVLLEGVVTGATPALTAMQNGLRAAARAAGPERADRALYVSNGEDGAICPNQYWVPGMLAPVPVSGKYYVDYGFEYRPPRELGASCAARMVREIGLDNVGLCRFQREWAEPRMADLLRAAEAPRVDDVDAHHLVLSRTIAAAADPRPPETRRAREFLAGYLEEVRRDDIHSDDLDRWCGRFREDPERATQAYWDEMRLGIAGAMAV
jgi:glyceraldehyde-3-phosphate dehydrogenase (ferredoxin)